MDYSLLNLHLLERVHLFVPWKHIAPMFTGLQVAVTVGLEGDPLGRKVLGLLVSASVVSASVTIWVAEVTGILRLSPPESSVVVSAGNSMS